MPITVPTSFLSFSSFFWSSPLTRSKLLAKANAQNVQIVLILKSSCILSKKNLWHFPLGRKTSQILWQRRPRAGWYFALHHAWPSLIGQAASRWPILIGPRHKPFVIPLGWNRMSCHSKNSPAFRNKCHFRFLKARVKITVKIKQMWHISWMMLAIFDINKIKIIYVHYNCIQNTERNFQAGWLLLVKSGSNHLFPKTTFVHLRWQSDCACKGNHVVCSITGPITANHAMFKQRKWVLFLYVYVPRCRLDHQARWLQHLGMTTNGKTLKSPSVKRLESLIRLFPRPTGDIISCS